MDVSFFAFCCCNFLENCYCHQIQNFIKIVHFLRLLVPLRTWLDKFEVKITNHHHLKLEM